VPLPSLSLARLLTRSTLSAAVHAGLAAALIASVTTAPFVLAAAPGPAEEHAYVVKITNQGDFAVSDATILDVVDTALQRWVVESEHVISSFTRVGGLHELATDSDCSDEYVLWDEAQEKLFPDVDFGGESGNHLIVIGPAACPSGHGTVGDDLHSGGLVTVRFNPDSSPQTLLHELGHNFGLEHAHALKCNPGCADVAYGNDYSFMGYTTPHDPAYVPSALDSYQRQRFGIDEKCEIRQARLDDGQVAGRATYVLAPRGTDDGARGVHVVDPRTGTQYYLDFRNGAGRDSAAYYVGSSSYREGVTVEKVTTDNDGDEVSQLQSTPDDRYGVVYAEVEGDTFQAGGVSVKVDRLGTPEDAQATATVTVTLSTAAGAAAAPGPLVDGCENEAVQPPESNPPTSPGVVAPSASPTPGTTPSPTPTPSTTPTPSASPTPTPSAGLPTIALPTLPTKLPTTLPTNLPTLLPTSLPTIVPTGLPTNLTSVVPTVVPTVLPVVVPSVQPTQQPTDLPPVTPTSNATPSTPSAPSVAPSAPASLGPAPSAGASTPATTAPPAPPTADDAPDATPDDTSDYVPRSPHHGLLPSTGSPRLLLAEIAAAAFALAFGLVLVLAARRPRARPAGRVR
jgi:hypothetical protein